jgi:hypothetical protein
MSKTRKLFDKKKSKQLFLIKNEYKLELTIKSKAEIKINFRLILQYSFNHSGSDSTNGDKPLLSMFDTSF